MAEGIIMSDDSLCGIFWLFPCYMLILSQFFEPYIIIIKSAL